jgi:hypothetical protein
MMRPFRVALRCVQKVRNSCFWIVALCAVSCRQELPHEALTMLSTVLLAGRGRLNLQTLILTHLKRRRGKLSLTWLNRLDFHGGSIVGIQCIWARSAS